MSHDTGSGGASVSSRAASRRRARHLAPRAARAPGLGLEGSVAALARALEILVIRLRYRVGID
ncbi:MAG: hypothetical protein H6713_13080 [Myxococcales bacterium]|nr:hypothetical protein [Myxococcales bacterium]